MQVNGVDTETLPEQLSAGTTRKLGPALSLVDTALIMLLQNKDMCLEDILKEPEFKHLLGDSDSIKGFQKQVRSRGKVAESASKRINRVKSANAIELNMALLVHVLGKGLALLEQGTKPKLSELLRDYKTPSGNLCNKEQINSARNRTPSSTLKQEFKRRYRNPNSSPTLLNTFFQKVSLSDTNDLLGSSLSKMLKRLDKEYRLMHLSQQEVIVGKIHRALKLI